MDLQADMAGVAWQQRALYRQNHTGKCTHRVQNNTEVPQFASLCAAHSMHLEGAAVQCCLKSCLRVALHVLHQALLGSGRYVGDLHPDVTEAVFLLLKLETMNCGRKHLQRSAQAMLYEIFNSVGPVASIRVCRDSVSRKCAERFFGWRV